MFTQRLAEKLVFHYLQKVCLEQSQSIECFDWLLEQLDFFKTVLIDC